MNPIQRKNTKKHLLTKRLISKEIFAYPTESFYALGADATNPKAVARLFRLKRRDQNKPIALIARNLKQVKKFFYMSATELKLVKKYWPGAVTILLRPKKAIAAEALFGPPRRATPPQDPSMSLRDSDPLIRGGRVRRGIIRIGVRVPAHAGARALAEGVGVPITATSANLSGQPPTKSIHSVKRDFPDILIIPGRCGRQHRPSTVVEIIGGQTVIRRPGSVKI